MSYKHTESYRFDDYVVDFSSYSVTYKNKKIKTTAMQLKLLCVFLRNPNKVLTRDYLLSKMELSPEVFDRSIDSSVFKLRKIPNLYRYLRSIYGIGYIFKAKVKVLKFSDDFSVIV